ncbi:HTH-type transcriptional activator RhaR [Pontiella desulfatans]|uniref:HTH-type transcriptional activator RhaR n=1 Tax=Pontiella desulfatans TaxID=2750659 RepID=A0A6C2UDB8_PONDE|nr:AraC family transcriptional regulator [Pontiella desulfatans]VGO17889.1 HTH-type transcriptional activator RhaR [Pontiella desulfatans]
MKSTIADGIHYFGLSGFPLAVRRVETDSAHTPSHPHDLTEIEHSHDFCELVIVTRGGAMHMLEGSVFPVTAGDVFLLQGRQRHYFYERKGLDLINIMYDPEKIALPENELRRMPGYCAMFMLEPTYRRQHRFASRLHLKRVPLARVERLAEEMEQECEEDAPGKEVALRAKLLELMVYLSRAYTSSDTTEAHALLRVGNVIGALENDFSKDWKLEDLLKIAHMSRSNLMRVFRKATGQTPIEYLVRLRIQRAMEMLRNSDLSVTEIALEVGFNDSNYFTRQFRRILGESPRSFRQGKE